MLLLLSWLVYVVCAVLWLVYPVQTSVIASRLVYDKRYAVLGAILVCSMVAMIVIWCHYGFWRMTCVHMVGSVVCSVRGYVIGKRMRVDMCR